MTPKKHSNYGSPWPTRGVSVWLWLGMVGFLIVGVWQMLYQKAETVRPEQIASTMQSSKTVYEGQRKSMQYYPLRHMDVDKPLEDSLANLIRVIQAEDDPAKREQLVADFLAGLKLGDLAGLLNLLKTVQPTELAEDLSQRLVRFWAESNPQALAASINNLPVGNQRQIALDALAITWANSQLTNAICWGQSLKTEGERNRALAVVANEAVRTDPMTALQLAVNLPADSQSDELIRRAATEWASGDATNAVAWAEQMPDVSLRATVLASESVAWAEQDPSAAATLAVKELPAGRLQDDTVVSIVERWAQQQPEMAAAWVAQFPAGSLRTAAIENLIRQWSQKDEAATKQWQAAHVNNS